MPQGNLPDKARKIYLSAEKSAEKTCPSGERHDECVARKAWAAVKRVYKKVGDKWVPKSTAEFSLFINKATFNKETQQMKWYAVASDIEPDLYNDEMSLELYSDFMSRIESKEKPPERHQSDYWSGGLPYLSVSHYLDLNGKGVPGATENVYVDGKCLKANGTFNNTVLGKACFDAICKDLYGEEKLEHENKIRISIAFIDWGHTHKSTGYEFVRESLDDLCPECLNELITGEGEGKIFQNGHLIHLALTRVPVNERTSMEVERSMTTQKEDAISIVGEEVFDETFSDEEKEELKAQLVIKSDQETEPEEETVVEEIIVESDMEEEEKKKKKKDNEKEEKADLVEEAVTKKEGDGSHPAGHYLVVEDSSKPSTWHLRVKGTDGKPDHRLMGAAWAALHGGYRGNKYSGPNKSEAIGKLKRMYKSEGLSTPSEKADYEPHILESAIESFLSVYNDVFASEMTYNDKLQAIQGAFEQFGEAIKASFQPTKEETEQETLSEIKSMLEQLLSRQDVADQKISILEQKALSSEPQKQIQQPVRRSLQLDPKFIQPAQNKPMSVDEISRKSVGLYN